MFGITRNVIGIILLIVGVILIVTGYQEYNTFGSRMGRAFGSTPSNRVLFMFIFGGICSLLGFLKIFKK